MRKPSRGVWVGLSVAALVVGWMFVSGTVHSQPPPPKDAVAEPAAPTGQTYIGLTRCGSCHFKQLMSWKKTKHAKEAWESVPAKYRASAECLPCHTTGYGQPTGFKDEASSPKLVGTTCEACHGPGSKHEEVCKQHTNKKLTPDEEKIARDSIYKVLPQNVCVSCHASKGHKEHPKYDKE
jgi:hypothetical protein